MAVSGLTRGYIGFFLEQEPVGGQGNGETTPIRWVKGSVHRYKKTASVSEIEGGSIMLLEVGGRKVYTKEHPFPEHSPPSTNLFFLDPYDMKSFMVDDTFIYGTMTGRNPKHIRFTGDRELYRTFPPTPNTTPTPYSVVRYENNVARLNTLVNIYFKGE